MTNFGIFGRTHFHLIDSLLLLTGLCWQISQVIIDSSGWPKILMYHLCDGYVSKNIFIWDSLQQQIIPCSMRMLRGGSSFMHFIPTAFHRQSRISTNTRQEEILPLSLFCWMTFSLYVGTSGMVSHNLNKCSQQEVQESWPYVLGLIRYTRLADP